MKLLEHFKELSIYPKNAKELKGLILQLAVQGKLTAAWRQSRTLSGVEGQSAKALLASIKAEKEQLIKDKKIKKEKPLPAITEDEIPYELPEDWEWCRYQDLIFSMFTGLERSKKDQSSDYNFPYLKMNNIGSFGRCNFSNFISVNATDKEVDKFKLKKGDFLFNTRNSIELVGKTCVFDANVNAPVLFNNNILKVDFRERVNSNYLNYYFSSPIGKELLDELKSATTNVAAIYQGKLITLITALPPLAEQKAIIETVNTLFKEVEA